MPSSDLRDPWLVAAWPGMGGVAIVAAEYLVRSLGGERIAKMDGERWFEVQQVQVREGVLQPLARPRTTIYGLRNPVPGGRDLLVVLGEAQPTARGWDFCRALLAEASVRGVRRVVTFAAMGTPSEPGTPARTFAVATERRILDEFTPGEVVPLGEGEINGLNGVLLGVAASQGLEGLCLLGEFPFFATALPNPTASASVLKVFSRMCGLRLDLGPLVARGTAVDRQLVEVLARAKRIAARDRPPDAEPEEEEDEGIEGAGDEAQEPEDRLGTETRARIEDLFSGAKADRSKALELKAELDRLGAFKEYEDRFLDLFKRAE